jgi:CSLREA domain-containing protein
MDGGISSDGGVPSDAGVLDSGTAADSGMMTQDSGNQSDAGMVFDSGAAPDAGVQSDGGMVVTRNLYIDMNGYLSLRPITISASLAGNQRAWELTGNGFSHLGYLDEGSSYSLEILIQPAFPAQTCTISGMLTDAAGSIGGADEVVTLTCTTDTFTPTIVLQGFSTTITVEDGQGHTESITPATGVPFDWPHDFNDGSVFHFRITQNSANGNERCWFHHGDDWVKGGAPPQVQLRCGNTIAVTTPDDTVDANLSDDTCADGMGQCSLRAAIMTASRKNVPAAIVIENIPYLLSAGTADATNQEENQGDLDIVQLGGAAPDLLIQGAGAATTTIDAVGLDGVFDVHQGTVVFADLTIQGGNTDGRHGGGILARSQSHVEMHRAHLVANSSIWSDGMGGGLTAVPSASATLVDVRVEANQAGDRGGGLYILGKAKVFRSLFVGNSADDGGAITVGDGNNAGELLVLNATFHQNHVVDNGAALRVRNGNADLVHASIFSNHSDGIYGAIYVDSTVTLNLYNSAIGDNNVSPGSTYGGDCRAEEPGNITAPGINYLRDDNDCGIDFDADDFTSTSAAPIESLVGLPSGEMDHREVLLPGAQSVLTDAAHPAVCPFLDQRSLPRPTAGGCEIGAAERQP